MISLVNYALVSTVVTVGVIYHAYSTREQFYPATLYLATSKLSVVVLGNMALVFTLLLGQLLKIIFLGKLREAEVERLNELARHEIMETCLAMTIFRQEFDVFFVAMFTALLFIKIFHWLCQKRVEYMETTPSVSSLSHVRIVTFMALLLLVDVLFLQYAASYTWRLRKPSVLLLFAFEYVILASSTIATFIKYVLYKIDMVMEGSWDNKAVFVFYLELVRDLLHLAVYLIFFTIIFVYYGLPLHLVRDLYETFRNFKARVSDFVRYRRITSNMNDRFADVTSEELGRGDATCIICREEMSAAKKLPCGHMFHVQCLRSWLERQQTCPTCRASVVPESPQTTEAVNNPQQTPNPPAAGATYGAQPYGQTHMQYGFQNPYAAGAASYAQYAHMQARIHAAATLANYGTPQTFSTWQSNPHDWYNLYTSAQLQQLHQGLGVSPNQRIFPMRLALCISLGYRFRKWLQAQMQQMRAMAQALTMVSGGSGLPGAASSSGSTGAQSLQPSDLLRPMEGLTSPYGEAATNSEHTSKAEELREPEVLGEDSTGTSQNLRQRHVHMTEPQPDEA
eukprot:SM000002S05569  [mRNA]  locus=s2:955123:958151:- [translate_table: standard]